MNSCHSCLVKFLHVECCSSTQFWIIMIFRSCNNRCCNDWSSGFKLEFGTFLMSRKSLLKVIGFFFMTVLDHFSWSSYCDCSFLATFHSLNLLFFVSTVFSQTKLFSCLSTFFFMFFLVPKFFFTVSSYIFLFSRRLFLVSNRWFELYVLVSRQVGSLFPHCFQACFRRTCTCPRDHVTLHHQCIIIIFCFIPIQ